MPLRNFVVIALTAIVALSCYSVASKNRYANLFAEALDVIDREALQAVPQRELFSAAMQGMMKQLDEHSMYITDDLFRAIDEDMNQEFGGVGMYIENDPESNQLIVLAPIPDTPAYNAGVKIGDEIVEIDGHDTTGMERMDAIKLLRGPQGSSVNVVFRRDANKFPVELVRASIPIPSVSGDWRSPSGKWNFVLEQDPRIGYIRLQQFGKQSTAEMAAAIGEIDGKIDGLILDLRNNAGGLLSAAIEISDMFLDEKVAIVRTLGRNQKLLEEQFSNATTLLSPQIPVVVLVNRNSASASEIVAACLQDHHRAVIVGEQSWGKGTVQNLIPVERGKSALKLTVRSFWRPSDRQIDRFDPVAKETGVWGVQPDAGFEVNMTEQEVFENIRFRNYRDLVGLNPAGAKLWLEAVSEIGPPETELEQSNSNNTSDPDTTSGPDAGEELPPQTGPVEDVQTSPEDHVDRPLERAREYLKSMIDKIGNAIAA